jgi:hypothetical protein
LILRNEYEGSYSKFHWNGTRTDYGDQYAYLERVYQGLRRLDFINDAAMFPYTENVALRNIYNICLIFQQFLTSAVPFIFENKLTKLKKQHIYLKLAEQESVCSDKAIHAATHKRLVVINILKLRDAKAWQDYGDELSKYLPNIEAKYISFGAADSFYWSQISLMSYASRTKFCEMILSKEVITSALPLRHRGVNESQTYTTFQILECHPVFRGCRRVDEYKTREDVPKVAKKM